MIGPFDHRLTMIAETARVRTSHVHHIIHALAEPPFDPKAFVAFTGLELHHVTRMLAALGDADMMPKPKRRSLPKATITRLPPAMQLPDEWLSYAQEKRRWPEDVVREVFQDFIDHWCGKHDGQAADWSRVWQGWVRRDRRPDGLWSPTGAEGIDPERIWLARERQRLSSGSWDEAGEAEWQRRRAVAYGLRAA